MQNYIFHTSAALKNRDSKKWWIDGGIVRDICIEAEDIVTAFKQYRERTEEYGVSVSQAALKNKQSIYVGCEDGTTQPIGYVITGKTAFDNNHNGYINKYIDLWVDIRKYNRLNGKRKAFRKPDRVYANFGAIV